MGFLRILWAEMKFVYADIFRRKSMLAIIILYPYMLTLFILLIGTSLGSTKVFIERIGVDPVVFFITSGFMMMVILGVSDDLLWKPIADRQLGTQPYIIASPVPRIKYYFAIPIPRLIIVLVLGLTSIVPIMYYYYGFEGIYEALVIIGLTGLSALLFVTFVLIIIGVVYGVGGENWRAINVIRPLLLVLMGVYYPRYMMPLLGRIASSLIPSSHVVEAIQRIITGYDATITTILMLIGFATALAIFYAPFGMKSMVFWEKKVVKEGVKT
ncbi:ABC transporter permease [Desulfurococcaceae archaeon MEX13E-LK6-19]|nr:ABC transporter permease [Desulfurococcaceae archaeon MEX13E-LK6-19]